MMNVLKRLDLEAMQGYLIGAGCTVFFCCIFLFAVLNFPGWKREFPLLKKDDGPAVWLIGVRIISGFGLALLPILLYGIGMIL